MTETSEHQYASLGVEPVSAEQPCGENVRYESAFEELEAELAKQESLSSETVDWNRVSTLSANILKNLSKDLLVASYLTHSLLITEGYSGLAVGLKILGDMVESHWDGLFPPAKRMRARATPITWLSEKAGDYVAGKPPTPQEAKAVIEAANNLKQLDNALVEKMGDDAPAVTDLNRQLKSYKQGAEADLAKAAEPAPPAEPAAAESPATDASSAPAPAPAPKPAAAPRAAAASSGPAAITAVESDGDAKKLLRQVQESLRTVTGYWAGKKLSDARLYRLARMATWLTVEIAPPATEGVTQIMPPAPERLKYFDTQIEKSEYSSVLPELELTLSRSPFWLDGQFKVVTVLRAMGGEYEAAAKTVIRETGNFINRIPEVMELAFSDQTPFVGDQTRMWLNSEVLAGESSGAADSGSASSGGAQEKWEETLGAARKKAAGGDVDAAIAMFDEGISSASQVRDKFYWRCALADLLLQTGKVDVATAMLEQMAQNAEEYKLTVWEPQLLAKIYSLLHQAYVKRKGKNKDDKTSTENIERTYQQLCWFDPVNALTAKGG